MLRKFDRQITDIQGYLNLIEEIKEFNNGRKEKGDLIFRGQRTDRPLLPRLARLSDEKKLKGKIKNIERLILNDFKRGILPLTEFKPENNWDLLALAQHHGLPTRLLDWTYSALVGLWFTVNRPPSKSEKGNFENGVVWILSTKVEDFKKENSKADPLDNRLTKIFRATVVSRRISAQAGLFTVHLINAQDKVYKFETTKNFKDRLTKVTVPHTKFASIRRQLSILGVNSSTIYPDINGLSEYLEWRYSRLSDEGKS